MRKNTLIRTIICVITMIVMMVSFTGCSKAQNSGDSSAVKHPGGEIGTGSKSFVFTVVDVKGDKTVFTVKTDKETVGEALVETGLIAGEKGAYGIYVKTVNGDTLDYDKDGKYWAFYINDEYAVSGVDKTVIEKDKTYTFKAE